MDLHVCPKCNETIDSFTIKQNKGLCHKGHRAETVLSFWIYFAIGAVGVFCLSMLPGLLSSDPAIVRVIALLLLLVFLISAGMQIFYGLKYSRMSGPAKKLAKQHYGFASGILLILVLGLIRVFF